MFARPDVDAIFCARGGSSCICVLEHLDFELIRAHPKVIVGYSDVTSLMLALWARAGLRSFFGPMVTPDWARGLIRVAQDLLWRLICCPEPAGPLQDRRSWAINSFGGRPGRRSAGRGNTGVGSGHAGNARADRPTRTDLLFEDIHESPARVERYLSQLGRAGILGQAAGFLVGPLRWDASDAERSSYRSFEEVLRRQLAPLGRPTLVGYPFGHVPNPLTLPLGTRVELDVDERVLTVMEPAVR